LLTGLDTLPVMETSGQKPIPQSAVTVSLVEPDRPVRDPFFGHLADAPVKLYSA
jgi:hypothetical protein